MKVYQAIKDELKKRNKKQKNMSMALDMGHSQFNRYLNGFERAPVGFERRIQEVFDQWDKEVSRGN